MQEKNYPYDVVVYIGRFEPYHNGHDALVLQALALGKWVVMVLGSDGAPSSLKNPLFADQRMVMIASCIAGDDVNRVLFAPVPDFGDNESWVAKVQEVVARAVPGAVRVALIGHFKDDSSYYLNFFPDWQLESVPRANDLDATTVRNVMFDQRRPLDERLAEMRDMVPAGALNFLEQWMTTAEYQSLADEYTKRELEVSPA
jgi:bifunctional NMN adenylyltransferase/nudix hydrolase